jgi:hypothetical protein
MVLMTTAMEALMKVFSTPAASAVEMVLPALAVTESPTLAK